MIGRCGDEAAFALFERRRQAGREPDVSAAMIIGVGKSDGAVLDSGFVLFIFLVLAGWAEICRQEVPRWGRSQHSDEVRLAGAANRGTARRKRR